MLVCEGEGVGVGVGVGGVSVCAHVCVSNPNLHTTRQGEKQKQVAQRRMPILPLALP